jgi:hypothetical protein
VKLTNVTPGTLLYYPSRNKSPKTVVLPVTEQHVPDACATAETRNLHRVKRLHKVKWKDFLLWQAAVMFTPPATRQPL